MATNESLLLQLLLLIGASGHYRSSESDQIGMCALLLLLVLHPNTITILFLLGIRKSVPHMHALLQFISPEEKICMPVMCPCHAIPSHLFYPHSHSHLLSEKQTAQKKGLTSLLNRMDEGNLGPTHKLSPFESPPPFTLHPSPFENLLLIILVLNTTYAQHAPVPSSSVNKRPHPISPILVRQRPLRVLTTVDNHFSSVFVLPPLLSLCQSCSPT